MEEEDTYHYDFTTASTLEIFIARLEEIILEWRLHQKPAEKPLKENEFKTKEWCTSSETIVFSEAEFLLTRFHLKSDKVEEEQEEIFSSEDLEDVPGQAILDMLSMENDFFPITNPPAKDSHPLARWYGLRDFLVLIPQQSFAIGSESRIKLLLSSLSVAINNTKCAVPFFIMGLEPWQNYFVGVYQSGNFRTEFNMVHLKKTPPYCRFLTELLCMFKSKIGVRMLANPVVISIQFTYVLKDWTTFTWTQDLPDMNFLEGYELNVAELGCLPFGSTYDSINKLYLIALWPSLLESDVVDSESYSDLKPLQAPVWKVAITTVDDLSCLLSDYYSEFIEVTKAKQSIRELLGSFINSYPIQNAKSSELSSSLNALTESKISAFSKVVMGGERMKKEMKRQSQQIEGLISSENLMIILYYLFPDADEESKTPYNECLGGTLSSESSKDVKRENIEVSFDVVYKYSFIESVTTAAVCVLSFCEEFCTLEDDLKKLNGMKSAPFDGLLWRLSIVMAHVIHSLGGVRSAAYLWYEFTQELRFRVENGILLKGLQKGFPDHRTCLLNQKLQLLNCCISRRIEREKKGNQKVADVDEEETESEEEFYDCDTDVNAVDEDRWRRGVKHAPWDKPVGRLSRHGDLKLLETGEPLYIPITQDPVPKTEDQIEEDEAALLQLGTDEKSSELRAQLMSVSLLSDMEAFKAANPGCVLADFIRWYSPRDWIEEEEIDEFGQRKGHLSKRMEIPGNMWLEVWQAAQPVPAKWQRRIFNDTREAEKVLDFLERKTPKEFVELLLPVIIVCVIDKLLEESAVDELPGVNETLSKLIKKAEILGRLPKIEANRYEELLNEITAVESVLVHAKSLKHKFMREWREGETKEKGKQKTNREEILNFIKNLLTGVETEVPGGPKSSIGFTIRHYFSEAAKAEQLFDSDSSLGGENWNVMSPFLSPYEKEIILRLSTEKGPQRLHAVLKRNECRISGAFTKNIYYP